MDFTGSRIDVLLNPAADRSPVGVRIDGKSPSSIPQLYGFMRVSAFPNSDWPVLLRVGSAAPLVAETRSLVLRHVSEDGKTCHFDVSGSVTGADGDGWSTNRFVSKSGRVVIEPDDWNLGFCYAVFKHPLPQTYEADWAAVLRGTDEVLSASPKPVPNGTEVCVTLAQGLTPGRHTLELNGANLNVLLSGVRVYCPQP